MEEWISTPASMSSVSILNAGCSHLWFPFLFSMSTSSTCFKTLALHQLIREGRTIIRLLVQYRHVSEYLSLLLSVTALSFLKPCKTCYPTWRWPVGHFGNSRLLCVAVITSREQSKTKQSWAENKEPMVKNGVEHG